MFILDYRNDIRQKANLRSFFICIKNGRKAEEVIHNISNTFGPGTANEHTVQWWFKKFCKGDESLENEEHTGQLSEVDNDKLREINEADPLKTTHEVTQELNIDNSPVS